MRIDDRVIDEIRDNASISKVIGHYIPIVKKGHNYVALCPFHDDHDPSLSISEEKQIYKCFVCGKGGNVFNFVMDFTKCTFPEAVAKVAEIIGRPLDIDVSSKKKPQKRYQKYHDLLRDAISFLSYALNTYEGKDAKDYLLKRGLDKDVVDHFDIGYDPRGDKLFRYLKGKGYEDREIEATNVGALGDYGPYDIFQNRIVFPIHDLDGDPIAFSARALDTSQVAKYINTKETVIYHKGEVVYNYHRAKDDAKKADRIIVCEGVMDVIALWRADIKNVVATLGTSLTKEQLKIIGRTTSHIVFFYDGDRAGRNATMKAVEMALAAGYDPYVIVNDTDKDPDEIINTNKAKVLRDMVSKEISGIEYAFSYYKSVYPFHSYSNRKAYMQRLSTLIMRIRDDYDRENFLHELTSITGLPLASEKRPKVSYNKKDVFVKREDLSGLEKAEYTILKMMMDSKVAVDIYRKELGCLFSEEAQKVAEAIISEYRRHGDLKSARLLDEMNDEHSKDLLLKVEMSETISGNFKEDIFQGAIDRIKLEINRAHLDELERKIKNADEQKRDAYLKEYTALIKELGGLRNGRDQD